jgi:non-specific serine/threonine protein kinase
MINLGLAALQQGHQERAAASFEEALAISEETGRKPSVINALEGMSSLAAALGESTRAAHLWGAAEATREATGLALAPVELALHEPYLVVARSQLGEAAWEEALTRGRSMPLEESVQYALTEGGIVRPTPPLPDQILAGEPASKLTRREEEIAALVAQGLTNRQIASRLSISERTAGNHVARILRKLGLRSRTQVGGWAAERQLHTPHLD